MFACDIVIEWIQYETISSIVVMLVISIASIFDAVAVTFCHNKLSVSEEERSTP